MLPEGFVFQEEFLTEEEESGLVALFRALPYGSVRMHGVAARSLETFTAKRRVAQFGWHYSFENFRLTPAPSPPAELDEPRRRAAALAGVSHEEFAEALVTEYGPGAGIGWHRDAPPFGIVAGISLGAACRMRFQRGKGAERITTAAVLPPRSIYLLTGAARAQWEHMIPPVRETRWPITFRTLRRGKASSNPPNHH